MNFSKNTLLAKVPFPNVQLVLLSQKRNEPAVFDKQILLHKTLCKKSQAVKLKETLEDLRLALAHEIREDEAVGKHIIDAVEASSTAVEGTLYVQCLEDQKQIVTDYIKDFLDACAKQHPDDAMALIVDQRPNQTTSSSASQTHTINTWNKFQSIIGSASFGTNSDANTTLKIPAHIDTQQMYSYTSVVSGS